MEILKSYDHKYTATFLWFTVYINARIGATTVATGGDWSPNF